MAMKSSITKRSIAIAGHKTSVSLEHEFWSCVKAMAKARTMTVAELVSEIGAGRTGNLSSALRVYVLEHYQAEASRHRSKAVDAPEERAGT
jgi:predicted DNA-binding ribbon-helix-helix protein